MSKKAKSGRAAEASSRRPRKPAAREKQASDRRSAVSRKGERPALHDDPVVDDLFGMVAALTAEISVALDRIATLERLLEQRGVLTPGGVEAYEADEAERVRQLF